MASAALQLPDAAPRSEAASVALPNFPIRTLDWPCWEAPSLRDAWDRLADCAVEANPYFESWHLLPALRALDPEETVQLLMFEEAGQLAGMIPLIRRKRLNGRRAAHLELWTHPDCHYGAPLVASGREREFWRALLGWTDGPGRFGQFLRLSHLALDGPLHQALAGVLAEQGRPAGVSGCEERPLLPGGPTPEDYFAKAVCDGERDEMAQKLQRLAGQGEVAFDRTTTGEGLAEWIDRFLELDPAGLSGNFVSTAGKLLRQKLEGASQRGRLERLTLLLGGRPIAMLANFIAPPGAFAHRMVCDEAYSDFSPGLLVHCENLLMLDRRDIAWTDSCARPGDPLLERLWHGRRVTGSISVAIGGKLRRALFARKFG